MNSLFGLKIYVNGKEELLNEIEKRNGKTHIISGNAEVLKYPLKDSHLFDIYNNKANIIIPDGISVYLPIKKRKVKEIKRIAGIELMQDMLKHYEVTGKSVYFLGAKKSTLDKMILRIKEDYPSLNIVGFHHGYIDVNNCSDVLNDIKKSMSYALFVAMGTPIQENFIFKYMDELPCSIYMGVGGSFDVFSGEISRCPNWVSKIGLEWFYRMIKDPSKIKRLWNNLYFTIKGLLVG